MAYTEQIINRTVTVGTTPVVVFEALQPGEEWVEMTVSNQSTASQTMRYAPTDGDIGSGGGLFLDVGGFYSESKSEGYVVSPQRRVAVASAASGTLYVYARKLLWVP